MSDPRAQNDRYLLRMWVPVAILVVFLIPLIVAAIAVGQGPYLVLPVVLLAGFGVWFVQLKARFRRGLAETGPERLIALALANQQPSTRAVSEANAAMFAAIFERTDLAEAHLAKVDWEREVAMVRANGSVPRALLHYVHGDWTEGAAMARSARTLSEVDDRFPGATVSRLAFDVHVALGAALDDRANATTRPVLDEGFAKLPLFGRLIAAWGLLVLAVRDGRADDAESHAAFIRAHAPHATLLTRIPHDASGS